MIKAPQIDRREMIKVAADSAALVVLTPTSAVPQHHAATAANAAESASWQPKFFTAEQNELVTTLAELILPETDSPGARAAKVNEYIDLVLSDETRSELSEHGRSGGNLNWSDEASAATRIGEMMALICATTEYQFA